ncbi:TPA: hypothetical protein I9Z81_001038 [Clostridium perfringens]|nr:hypothetical protein [Clostridium perfringens]
MENLTLDFNNFSSRVGLGTYEKCDSLTLNIMLDEKDYAGYKFKIIAKKSDGHIIEQDIKEQDINREERIIKTELNNQFTTKEGVVKLEINMIKDGKEDTTKEAFFIVRDTINGEVVESTSIIPTLEGVKVFIDEAVSSLGDLEQAGEDIALINGEFKENEIKRKANELLRERSEKERVRLESIRTTEEADRLKSEAERKEAENNRKVAESNRKLAENTRKTNEAARVEAELNRQSLFEENEEIRNENENLRIEAEKERKLTFSNNNKFESERVEAEKLRAIAEDKRVTAEKARANAEEERIKAETRRENTYTDFNDSEVERKNNEANRVRAETERVKAESGRNELFNTNEEKRNSTFIESERTRERAFNEAKSNRNEAFEESERVREEAFKVSEAARNEAEEGRVEAESERVKSEKARALADEERNTTFTQKEEERNNTFTQNETNRNNTFTQSEEERKGIFEEAENARKVAESKRVKSESSRVEAETLRVTAETGRVEAENLRIAAEEERKVAETKRDEKIKELENKIDNGGNNSKNEEVIQARTATTGEVFNTLDERIDNEVDRLNKKIDVTMLQQEDKGSHLVENTVEGMTTDMVIKGRTFNNLITNGQGTFAIDKSVDGNSRIRIFSTTHPLQTGKTYKGYLVMNNIENANRLSIYGYYGNTGGLTAYGNSTLNNNLGIIKFTWTPTNSNNDKFYLNKIGLYLEHSDFNNGAKATFSDFMLFEEGTDLTYIDEYFEGIKSFGQEEDKISILSHGKNLFDYNKLSGGNIVTFNNKKCYKYIDNANNFSLPINGVLGKQYTLSIKIYRDEDKKDKSCNVEFVYSDGTKDSKTFINGALVTYITTLGKRLIKIKGNFNYGYNCYIDLECTQLEEGTQFTSFEKYQSDKKDILLQNLGFDEGLRGINDISDELNSLRNVAIKRIGKREYREGDELLENIITDKTNTYYVLEEPIETPLDENINLKTFGEKTYVSFENTINGTSSFKAPANTVATISRLNRENRALEEENAKLKENMIETSKSLIEVDTNIIATNWEIDFRVCEVEWTLEDMGVESPVNLKIKKGVGNMALSRYEQAKIMILGGVYEKETLTRQLDAYLKRKYVSQEEYDELIALMEARDMVTNQ